ncbi:MAG: F0F1 ATP synthase subunit B [Acuticoccus sp.]
MSIQLAQADTAPAAADHAAPAAEAGSDAAHAISLPQASGEAINVPIQHGHGAAESLFPPFDVSAFPSHLFWIAISFGLLYFFVNRLIVPQVGGIIEDRRDRIASDLGEASRLSRETDEVIAIYEQELADARHKAYGIAQERRDELKAEQARQQAETEASLQKRIEEAEAEIVQRRDSALADVGNIATEAAQAIAKQVAGLTVDKRTAAAAVKRQEA